MPKVTRNDVHLGYLQSKVAKLQRTLSDLEQHLAGDGTDHSYADLLLAEVATLGESITRESGIQRIYVAAHGERTDSI